ncbi:MAG: SDR family oxidoreductase [Microthrixaceae bacterium]
MAPEQKVLVAGASGYVGRYVAEAFKQRGYWVRALCRDADRLARTGPFDTPAVSTREDISGVTVDDVFVGELTRPETLDGLMDDIDIVFSSVGISRQRDRLSFEDVDYGCNHTLIEMARAASVSRFVYVSMQGADEARLANLAITRAHERIVDELGDSGLEHRIVRPCGYFSDMGALMSMARRGVVLLVGDGSNRMSPIHGRDLAEVCVDAAASDAGSADGGGIEAAGGIGAGGEIEAGGPQVMTQREAAELAFEVLGRKQRILVLPMGVAKAMARGAGHISSQFGDLAEFIVVAGEIDGVGPPVGRRTLRSYFEELAST